MEQLRAPQGANKKKVVIGRGYGCRKGGTCGKGTKGQNARAGGGVRPGFEGGQMPLFRRIARRGFSNYPFKKEYAIINLDQIENSYSDGETVNIATLVEKRILKNDKYEVKILSRGDFTKKLSFKVDKISKSAKEKIEKAGGTFEVPEERE